MKNLVSLALVATLALGSLGFGVGSASAQWRAPRAPHAHVIWHRPPPVVVEPPVVVAPPYRGPVIVRPIAPPFVRAERRMERREMRRGR